MGQIALPVVAAAALQTAYGITRAVGESRATSFRAAEATRAARAGRTAAAETDTTLREELSSVISNIRAIRASAGIHPDSPTTRAVIADETRVSDRERRIRVANITRQAEEDERSAKFLRRSARNTFIFGSLGAAGRGFTTLASR